MENINEKQLLTVTEAAELLRINPQTLYRWISDGKIPCIELPGRQKRFNRQVLMELIGTNNA